MGRVIAISNRTAADSSARAGGLAVAVWDTLRSSGGSWIGWSGAVVDEAPRGTTTFIADGVEFILTDLTHEEHEGYYTNYANRVLWPIFHYRVDLASFDGASFDVYMAVNQRFAKLATTRLNGDDLIWVHDYHLLPLGDCIRRLGWTGRAGFFLHIPFPAPEIFRAMPEHRQISRAMCAYDVVGFQSNRDRANFVRCLVEDHRAVERDDGLVDVFNTTIKVQAYPIGIDAEQVAEMSTGARAEQAAARIARFLGDRQLVVGVDRMDYSKGLPERFEAVGQLFDAFPDTRGAVSVTQIAPPSRSKVEEYRDLRIQLDRLAGRINGDYGDLDWMPLRYLARAYDRDELAGLFRMADVGLVTPLRDGMNLVAKEFVMAQDPEDPGVLILSEFAGAAEQLDAALIVNPHDRAVVAETIHHALHMPQPQRIEHWSRLRDVIVREDVNWWAASFLHDLSLGLVAS